MPEDEHQQAAVVAFLSKDAERISTHGAHVFLRGDRAIKLKRAVKYSFMDFSTVEKRRRALEAELSLNAPIAPDLYLGVEPICDVDGRLTIGGAGRPLEWVLIMRRFRQDDLLSEKARAGGISADTIESLAHSLVEAHRTCPRVDRAEFDEFRKQFG